MAKRTIYYLVADAGDGSAYVEFFDSMQAAELMMEHELEVYSMNDGMPNSFELDGEISEEILTEESVMSRIREDGATDDEDFEDDV